MGMCENITCTNVDFSLLGVNDKLIYRNDKNEWCKSLF